MTRSGHAYFRRYGLIIESVLDERMFECGFYFMKSSRIVAIYLCVDCSRKLWYGLVERKIRFFNPDFPNWWSNWVAPKRLFFSVSALREPTPTTFISRQSGGKGKRFNSRKYNAFMQMRVMAKPAGPWSQIAH